MDAAEQWTWIIIVIGAVGSVLFIINFLTKHKATIEGILKIIFGIIGIIFGIDFIFLGIQNILTSEGYPITVILCVLSIWLGGWLLYRVYNMYFSGKLWEGSSNDYTPPSQEEKDEWAREDRIKKDVEYIKDQWNK